jgi:putative transposase
MNTYKRHRFPPDIISYAVWLYYRFNLSHRDIEDLLAERGITVSRESIRLWCIKFGTLYTLRLKRNHRGFGDTFYIDEVFAGVPDHSDQRQTALPLASGRSGEPAP